MLPALVAAVLAATLVGVVAVLVVLRAVRMQGSSAGPAADVVVRRAVEAAGAVARAERSATVREAVEAAANVAGGELGRSLAAGSRDADVRNQAIHRQMHEMAAHLRQVGELVGALQADRARQHGELLTRITEAQEVTRSLAGTTEGLHRVLANPQARGQWGERMAADVLRSAGFVEGINHVTQRTLPDGSRPDVTFLLPDDRVLHMDVKFPIAGYARWHEAAGDPERQATARAAFLRDVRARVRELARPGYADESTVGFVLLFLPNESVYGFLHEHDPRLADEALAQRVVLCSPFTLFAVLAVIRQACDAFTLERSADAILGALGGLTGQWGKLTERLDAMGRQLQTVQNTFDQVSGPRRRAVERQLGTLDELRRERGVAVGPPAAADDDGGDDHVGPAPRGPWDAEIHPFRGAG